MDISSLFIQPKGKLKQAINILEKSDIGIVLVVNEENILLGTITDGDIRRALIRGVDLDENVSEVMKKEIISITDNKYAENKDSLFIKAEGLMMKNNITQIPVIDNEGKILKIISRKDIDKSFTGTLPRVVIMAGGLGSRLLPLTESVPKPMLKLGKKPMLEIVLSHCIRAGLKEFYFAVNYLKDQIIDYFGDGSDWGVSINYLEEKKPLGTAGALKLFPIKDEKLILVLNGDVITNLHISNLINFHMLHDSHATICVREYLESLPYGVVDVEGEVVHSIKEKPTFSHYVNAGIYLLNPSVLNFIKKDKTLDMPDLLNIVIKSDLKVTACPIHEYWLDVGQHDTLKKAKNDWETNYINNHL